jgi:hypothetical protein
VEEVEGIVTAATVSGPSHTAEQIATCFNAKIETIRADSADAPPPTIRPRVVENLDQLNPVSVEEIDKHIMAAPNKNGSSKSFTTSWEQVSLI